MFNLDNLLAAKLLAKKQYKKVLSTQLILEETTNKIYFVIEVQTDKILKTGEIKSKFYKNDISSYIKNHGTVEKFFKALVVSEMMLAGYLLIPIDGGFICTGGEEIYSIKDNQCTCPAFLNDNSKQCKHLLYKEGLLEQRSRINEWKLFNLK